VGELADESKKDTGGATANSPLHDHQAEAEPQAKSNGNGTGVTGAADADHEPGEQHADGGNAEGSDDGTAEADGEDVVYEEERVIVMRRPVFIAASAIVLLLIAALAAGNVLQWRKGSPVVATVDGSTITRAQYDQAVARGGGADILDSLITRHLVEHDAAKNHVVVTPDEVDAKVKEAKAQVGTEDDWKQALAAQHLTELQARDTFRLNVMVQKLVFDKVQVSDADIQQYFDQNKDSQFKDKTIDQVKDQIKQKLSQSKQQEALQTYISGLRSGAKIKIKVPGA
jgi:parvulin-like peptidyl-prolyl isomerase